MHLVMSYRLRSMSDDDGVIDGEDILVADGVLLYMSTSSYRVSEYLVFWSPVEPGLGFTSDSWFYWGSLASVFSFDFAVARAGDIAVAGYVEAYLFKNDNGHVDCYARHRDPRPSYRFSHHQLDVADPADFWTASRYSYIRTIDRRDLIRLQVPRD